MDSIRKRSHGQDRSKYDADNQLYLTTDRGRAAYFVMAGEECVGCVPAVDDDNPDRQYFVIVEIGKARKDELENRWLSYGKEVMSAREYFDTMKAVIYLAKNPLPRERYNQLRGEA